MEKRNVEANPGRLIGAIANIGYDTEVALCDLLDNCIDAKATSVNVVLEKESHESEGLSDTIGAYIIADDGIGMDEQTLIGAFTLGTDKHYASHSLGKFGLGLKSAGLSLGGEIILLTAQEDSSPLCARLAMADIQATGKYQIELGEIPSDLDEYWTTYGGKRGTVLIIRALNQNRPAYSRFVAYLERYCSMIYHRFLERADSPLVLSVNGKLVTAYDPLFLDVARTNGSLGDAAQWDGQTIHLLLEGVLELPGADDAEVAATHLIHPPSFGPKQHEVGEQYAVVLDPHTRRARHGFYVYRNDRIIVLAERFHGVIGSTNQNWALRGSLTFDETADTLLSLDVKKRHCQLPPKVRSNLKAMIGVYQAKSVAAWRAAGKKVAEERKATKDKVANQSIANAPTTSLDDYSPGSEPVDDDAIARRRQRQKDISAEALDSIHDESLSQERLDEHAEAGDVVIKVQGIKGNAMWLPYPAISVGKAETLVNEQHSWVSEAYQAAEEEPSVAIVLHHLFTILARAELDLRSRDWPGISDDQVKRIFERYRRLASSIGEDLAEQLEVALATSDEEEEQ